MYVQAYAKSRKTANKSTIQLNYSPGVETDKYFKENILCNSFINQDITVRVFKGSKFYSSSLHQTFSKQAPCSKVYTCQIKILADSYSHIIVCENVN